MIKLKYNLHTAFCCYCHLLILDHVAFISLAWVIDKSAFIFSPCFMLLDFNSHNITKLCTLIFKGQLCVRNGCEYMNLNHTLEPWLKKWNWLWYSQWDDQTKYLKKNLNLTKFQTLAQLFKGWILAGGLWISSDGDDQMGAKIKTQKYP